MDFLRFMRDLKGTLRHRGQEVVSISKLLPATGTKGRMKTRMGADGEWAGGRRGIPVTLLVRRGEGALSLSFCAAGLLLSPSGVPSASSLPSVSPAFPASNSSPLFALSSRSNSSWLRSTPFTSSASLFAAPRSVHVFSLRGTNLASSTMESNPSSFTPDGQICFPPMASSGVTDTKSTAVSSSSPPNLCTCTSSPSSRPKRRHI
mmetsp:Transcript_29728/g.58903  ORF Transcript_29728/g.58903 Transcript_29728/m.58903 type:complete len:205 (+) Transcript_29728:1107-1721(+)